MAQTCHPSAEDVEAGESDSQGYSGLHSELEPSLGYVRPYLKQNNKLFLNGCSSLVHLEFPASLLNPRVTFYHERA